MSNIRQALLSLLAPLLTDASDGYATLNFDFGAAETEADHLEVTDSTTWSADSGYGWIAPTNLNLRDRGVAGALRRDFVFANTEASPTFRVSGLEARNTYLMHVLCGDDAYGDHITDLCVAGMDPLPSIAPRKAQYLELTTSIQADDNGVIDITFSSPTNNWIINALSLEPATETIEPTIQSKPISEWDPTVFADDPTQALLDTFDGTGADYFSSTGLSRNDYLKLIEGQIDFWKKHQNKDGAIIDPYNKRELQYSTPAYANAAAVLVVYAGRSDLLESASLAMDWASSQLNKGAAADGHDDFYPGMLAHAYRLLSPKASSTRAAKWKANLEFDPYAIYNFGHGTMNWNVVSACGEALFQLQGIRPQTSGYTAESWAAQGRH